MALRRVRQSHIFLLAIMTLNLSIFTLVKLNNYSAQLRPWQQQEENDRFSSYDVVLTDHSSERLSNSTKPEVSSSVQSVYEIELSRTLYNKAQPQSSTKFHEEREKSLGTSIDSETQAPEYQIPDEVYTAATDIGNVTHEKPVCNIPVLDPFDPSIMKFYNRVHFYDLKCPQVQPYLTYIDNNGFIHLNTTSQRLILEQFPGKHLKCTVNTLDRATGDDDDAIEFGAPRVLLAPRRFEGYDAAQVNCTIDNESVYFNLHAHPKRLNRKIENSDEDHLSIFIFFQDSASPGDFYRYLPRTTKFLEEMGMRTFHGHTKVGDNSQPNMVAVLTGLRSTDEQPDMLPDVPKPLENGCIDTWPIIWSDFASQGYATAFVEESPAGGIFNYLLGGFARKPVDHYLRPYFLNLERTEYPDRNDNESWWPPPERMYCYGNEPVYSMQLDYMLRLQRRYKGERLFVNCEFTKMSHNYQEDVNLVDYMFFDFFDTLSRENLLNKTVVIVMADHGPRFSVTRQTLVGLLEERMPMLGIVFPAWFLKKYPQIDGAIKKNQHRLTAHFDTHQTMVDILNSNFHSRDQLPHGTRGLSLLREIPLNRTCTEAGIPEHFCVCPESVPLNTSDYLVQKAAQTIITTVNLRIAEAGLSEQCHELILREILRGEELKVNKHVRSGIRLREDIERYEQDGITPIYMEHTGHLRTIRVSVVADPSGGIFEATVSVDESDIDDVKLWIPGDISRTNRYGTQSACINHFVIRKYCFCR